MKLDNVASFECPDCSSKLGMTGNAESEGRVYLVGWCRVCAHWVVVDVEKVMAYWFEQVRKRGN